MAVESVTIRRVDQYRWRVRARVDGDDLELKVLIPDPLPAEYATPKAFMKAQVRNLVVQHRAVVQRDADDAAGLDAATNQPSMAAEFLTDLQTELDTGGTG